MFLSGLMLPSGPVLTCFYVLISELYISIPRYHEFLAVTILVGSPALHFTEMPACLAFFIVKVVFQQSRLAHRTCIPRWKTLTSERSAVYVSPNEHRPPVGIQNWPFPWCIVFLKQLVLNLSRNSLLLWIPEVPVPCSRKPVLDPALRHLHFMPSQTVSVRSILICFSHLRIGA
jgi:hypothetical protein